VNFSVCNSLNLLKSLERENWRVISFENKIRAESNNKGNPTNS